MNKYKLGQFSKLIEVHPRTLQRWDNENKLIAFRTKTNRRYYTNAHYQLVMQMRQQQE